MGQIDGNIMPDIGIKYYSWHIRFITENTIIDMPRISTYIHGNNI